MADALGLAEPVAVTLVRRGYRTPEQAREFLEGSEAHDPLEFRSMAEIVWRLRRACEKSSRITVHGDYDVDGVCSTTILVRALRELGGSVDWFIPDRASDGYGLTLGTVAALAERGTELILTADCGIACAEEVEAAKEAGIEVIVTDHHSPPERLPDCPILHPVVSGYPFTELCATAVAYKLSERLRREGGLEECLADRQLVALATVADMVPLVGENRRLVREGIAEARRGACLGLRALIAVSHTDATRLDAGDLGFRIAPRINAAGRLYRADAGVELMLTGDGARAAQIAAELDRANFERRAVERQALDAAELALAKLAPGLRDAPGIVLAGQGWHPGVIGIVASRLVERHAKPVILIALDGEVGRGSGRGIPGFDLVAGLAACEGHLIRFGGHAAAAGLEIEAAAVEEFRGAFLAHARESIDPESLVRSERIDAFAGVGAEGIGIDLAEQLERLGPFGSGNPEPRLLVPAARVREVRPMGESGDHVRFQLESGAGRALGVAFNAAAEVRALEGGRADLAVRLEVDRWNGAVQPRVVLGHSHPLPDPEPLAEHAQGCESPAGAEEWWRRFEAELTAPLDWPAPALCDALDSARAGSQREPVDRRGGATLAAIAELASSGERVLALCADAARRRGLVELAGFGGELELADWASIARAPAALQRFEHLVLVEPPPFEHLDRLVAAAARREGEEGATPLRRGYLHLAWGEAELDLAERLLEREWS
ncbi:MAG: single-stranded-DNA-specific exonuclease RecJ, partial [Solirubrobacterales bacterium]